MENSKEYTLYVAYCRYISYRYSNQKIIETYFQALNDKIHESVQLDFTQLDEKQHKELQAFSHEHLILEYALLYVVIDCFNDLKLKDNAINILLQEVEMVEKLRNLRKAVFHPKRYRKFIKVSYEFMDIPNSAVWIQKMRDALSNFFINHKVIGQGYKPAAELLQVMTVAADSKVNELLKSPSNPHHNQQDDKDN